MSTERLYYRDSYMQMCHATVSKVIERANELVDVVLDRTCFFPQGGGVSGDTGTLNNVPVRAVWLDRTTGEVCHPIARSQLDAIALDQPIHCAIDWNRRYRIMRLHAASHIMEHFLLSILPELRLLGSNLDDRRDASTYSGPDITDDLIDGLNMRANDFIAVDRSIETYDDAALPGRRLWKCGDIMMPCGGLHPKSTTEIGSIMIRKTRGGKKQEIRTMLAETDSTTTHV